MDSVFYYDSVNIHNRICFLAISNEGLVYVGINEPQADPVFNYYPNRMLIHDPKKLAPYTKELKEYFDGKRRKFDVAIDISNFGTPFQRQVLQVVSTIPYGTTVTYGDIAAALDNARSVRAVAHAVVLNPILIFIPDHRVVMADGHVGGYRLGGKEKASLINLEKSYLHDNP